MSVYFHALYSLAERLVCLFGAALFLSVNGCALCSDDPSGPLVNPKLLPRHTVVFGGDIITGRQFNAVLHHRPKLAAVFGDVKPLLRSAGAALVNVEGVIAKGGRFTDKGETDPHMYRAHPNAVEVLSLGGIDVVTVGNNHSGDYGPFAFREMLDRLSRQGIQYTGGGYDAEDARRPAYVTLGDTVVAFVGADLTKMRQYAAARQKPGTLFFGYAHRGRRQDETVAALTEILEQAKKNAHVVLFTPHWGDNWKNRPTPHLRRLAKRLIRAGFDGILGHSAHWFQGVEVFDDKPVIYDAGNLILDYGTVDKAHRAFLWELEVTRAGVVGARGHPLWLTRNRANLAKGELGDDILNEQRRLSRALGTELAVESGAVVLRLSPAPRAVRSISAPPPRQRPKTIREAPSGTVVEALPEGAVKVDVAYQDGIRLIGYELLRDELTLPRSAQVIHLYFTADQKIEKNYLIHVEARGLDPVTGNPKKETAGHFAGDWMLPTDQWPVDQVICDATLFRLYLKPEGSARFYAGLWDGREMAVPISSDQPLTDNALVFLGETAHRPGAKPLSRILSAY